MKNSQHGSRQELGQRIARLRRKQRLSTKFAGKLANLHPGRIWAIEQGYVQVTAEELVSIATILGADPTEFFAGWDLGEAADPKSDWACLGRG
jgi:transcriptional regulator with XRE-family HTH domain